LIGEVKEIDIFNTQLVSPDNKRVIIPNGTMANGNIVNYTVEGKIRVDIQVGVAYSSDLKKAK
jgi:small conductance mechanosensitive channel